MHSTTPMFSLMESALSLDGSWPGPFIRHDTTAIISLLLILLLLEKGQNIIEPHNAGCLMLIYIHTLCSVIIFSLPYRWMCCIPNVVLIYIIYIHTPNRALMRSDMREREPKTMLIQYHYTSRSCSFYSLSCFSIFCFSWLPAVKLALVNKTCRSLHGCFCSRWIS